MAVAYIFTRKTPLLLGCALLLVAAALLYCSPPLRVAGKITVARDSAPLSPLLPAAARTRNSSLGCVFPTRRLSLPPASRFLRLRATVSTDPKRTGFILSLTFREQQTKSAANLYSLQCWAETMRVNIVEPFLQDSRMVVPLDSSQEAMLRFSDLFDLQQWDKLTSVLGFPPLAPWEVFVSDAPRDLIIVHLHYSSLKIVHKRITSGEKATHLAFSDAYKQGCIVKSVFSRKLKYLTDRGFRVAREVCVNFEHGDELTLFQFNNHILGPYQPKDVTILLDEWRGFTLGDTGKRVLVTDTCDSAHLGPFLRASSKIHCDAKTYQEMFLQSSAYIAVIVRTEKIRQTTALSMQQCLQRTLDKVNAVHNATHIKNVFLSMDIGKYGSSGNRENDPNKYKSFITSIYGSGSSIDMWEKSFEAVTDLREAGYIAALQKALVAEARCVVAVGGGSFQRHTLILHKNASNAKGRSRLCVHIIQECSKNLNR